MTFVSIAGVAIGVAALIIVLSVMGGFENDLRHKMLHGYPNIEVLNSGNAQLGLSLQEFPLENLKKKFDEIISLAPFTKADVVIKQRKHLTSALLLGVDVLNKDTANIWSFISQERLLEGSLKKINQRNWDILEQSELPGIVLGSDLADDLGVSNIGEVVEVISPQADIGDVLSDNSLVRHYTVVGLFQSGVFSSDRKLAIVSLKQGRKFLPEYDPSLDDEEYATGIAVNIKDAMDVESVAEKFEEQLKVRVLTWKQSNQSLLIALKLEKFTMGTILALIVVVAAFSISGTMMMTVYYKRAQVGLLRAIGATRTDILNIFLIQGGFIGLVGVIFGACIGLGVCVVLDSGLLINLPQGVYQLQYLPVKFLPFEYFVIAALALVFSLFAALYPALTAANQSPSSGLRYH